MFRVKGWKMMIGLLAVCLLVLGSVAMAADKASVTGLVEKGEAGLTLKAGDQTYSLLQADKMGELVGKQVKVTGVAGKDDKGNQTLTVEAFEEVK